MLELTKQELVEIDGGISISGTLINSFSTIIKTIANIGRNLGSAIRRIGSSNMCPLQ